MDKPTRRIRGNGEPPEDLPIQYWHDDTEEVEKEVDDTIALLWFIVITIAATVVMMFAWGKLG